VGTDTYVDGGGVFADTPLDAGTRLRLCPTDDPTEDVNVWVNDGKIHVVGQYSPLAVRHAALNHVIVQPAPVTT
jgi:cytosine/adenosine deaminase-related metal-dependent hydrolase